MFVVFRFFTVVVDGGVERAKGASSRDEMVEMQTALRDKEGRLAHTVVDYLVSPPSGACAVQEEVSHACLQLTVVGCGSAFIGISASQTLSWFASELASCALHG